MLAQNRTFYCFEAKGYDIAVAFLHDKVSCVLYKHDDKTEIYVEEIKALLAKNVLGAKWAGPLEARKGRFEWYAPYFYADL